MGIPAPRFPVTDTTVVWRKINKMIGLKSYLNGFQKLKVCLHHYFMIICVLFNKLHKNIER
jgi:hypothetical protein